MGNDAEQIILTMRQFLEPHQPKDYHLFVPENGVRQSGDWWEVVVQPDKDDVRSYEYHTILAETENELEEQTGLNVLLVPILPA